MGRVRAVSIFACFTLAFALQLRENITEINLSQGSRKVPEGTIQFVDMAVFCG
jgi:hypothetical protein